MELFKNCDFFFPPESVNPLRWYQYSCNISKTLQMAWNKVKGIYFQRALPFFMEIWEQASAEICDARLLQERDHTKMAIKAVWLNISKKKSILSLPAAV